MWNQIRHGLLLLTLGLALIPIAHAGRGGGKPKPEPTYPVTLTPVSPYAGEPLFGSAEIVNAIKAQTAETVTRVDLLGGYTAICANSAGQVLVEFEAYDASPESQVTFSDYSTNPSEVLTGIAYYDDTTGTLQVSILGRNYWAEGATEKPLSEAYPEYARGVRLQGIAVVPSDAGLLRKDDVVILRAAYASEHPEGVLEVLRLARADESADELIASWQSTMFNAQGQIAVDASGAIYVSSEMIADTARLYRVDQSGSAWDVPEDITPSFGSEGHAPIGTPPLAVSPSGTVYTVGPSYSDYAGEIWAMDASTGAWSYFASFDQESIPQFRALTAAGDDELVIALGSPNQPADYLANVLISDAIQYADRFAETTSQGVRGLTVGSDGAVYCIHEERDPDTNSTTHATIYRLVLDTSSDGGDDSGDTGGGGKGKNK